MRRNFRKGKGKSRGRATTGRSQRREHTPPLKYMGTDTSCSLCLQDFHHGEVVARVVCNHLFHSECWKEFQESGQSNLDCPNCRGPSRVEAVFRYIGNTTSHSARDSFTRARQRFDRHEMGDDQQEYAEARSRASVGHDHRQTDCRALHRGTRRPFSWTEMATRLTALKTLTTE